MIKILIILIEIIGEFHLLIIFINIVVQVHQVSNWRGYSSCYTKNNSLSLSEIKLNNFKTIFKIP